MRNKTVAGLCLTERQFYLPSWILLIVWIAVQLYLLFSVGLVTELEAEKYISQARYFVAHGHFEERRYLFYSVQILLLSICVKLGDAWWVAYLVQVLISGYACRSLYRFVSLQRNGKSAWLISFIWIVNIPVQTFNVYLQTESIFISSLILYLIWLIKNRNSTNYLLTSGIFLLLLCLIRPTGLLIIPATVFYVYSKNKQRWSKWRRRIYWSFLSVTVTLVINFAMNSGGEWDFLLPFETRQIICGVPTTEGVAYDLPVNPNSVQGLMSFIFMHPVLFLELALKRFIAFVSFIRAYYSFSHNLFLVGFYLPLWIAGILHSIRLRHFREELTALWLVVAAFAGIAILTCDDWHNRLSLTATTAIFLMLSFSAAATGEIQKAREKSELPT